MGKPKRKRTGPGKKNETKRAAKSRIRTSRGTSASPAQIERVLEQAGATPAPEQGLDAHDGTGENVPCAGEEPR